MLTAGLALATAGWMPPRLVLDGDVVAEGELPAEDPDYVEALYLRFDNDGAVQGDAASIAVDEGSPAGNHAAAAGDPEYIATTFGGTVPQTGEDNTLALDLEADDGQYLSVSHHPSLAFDHDAFTLEAWVKLDTLAHGTSTSDRGWLMVRKELGLGDESITYAFLVQMGAAVHSDRAYGKSSNHTGSELGVILGDDGSDQQWVLISNLEITDHGWHHVSVAVDRNSDEARFTLDGEVDDFRFEDLGYASNDGPLIIGGHPNAQGSIEGTLDAEIDEVRICRGVVPVDQLLDAKGSGPADEVPTYTLDYGTRELGSCQISLVFEVANEGSPNGDDLVAELDLDALTDPRITVTGEIDAELPGGETSDLIVVTFEPTSAGSLEGQELTVLGKAAELEYEALGSPATIAFFGGVEGDDDDDDAADDDDVGDDDAPGGRQGGEDGCECSAGGDRRGIGAVVAAGVLVIVGLRWRRRR